MQRGFGALSRSAVRFGRLRAANLQPAVPRIASEADFMRWLFAALERERVQLGAANRPLM